MSEAIGHMDELEQDRFEARYFNTLPIAEARAFDAELQRDPELAKRYRAFQLTIKGILSTREQKRSSHTSSDLRQHLQQIDREMDGSVRRPGWYWLAAAAAVLLALGLWWLQRPPAHERLAKEFSIVEPGLPVLMNHDKRKLDPVMNDLKLGDHGDAQEKLEAMLAQSPSNDTLQYFAGIVAGELGQADRAIEHLQKVPANSVFSRKALYHTAIHQLHLNRADSAKVLLQKIAKSGNDQLGDRARELLDRL